MEYRLFPFTEHSVIGAPLGQSVALSQLPEQTVGRSGFIGGKEIDHQCYYWSRSSP